MKCQCPYCSKFMDDPDDCYEPDTPYEHECPHCGVNFIFYVSYIRIYDEHRAPCLNGEEHDWKPIKGYPEEYFINKECCSHCQAERTV